MRGYFRHGGPFSLFLLNFVVKMLMELDLTSCENSDPDISSVGKLSDFK